MKKNLATLATCMIASVSFAQYTTGTSTTTRTDVFGNTVTTHRDAYGRTTGTFTTGSTDVFGNKTTQQRSNNSASI